ncbi:MAG: protein kinase domain-containing protein [Burkholderiales bacterium]
MSDAQKVFQSRFEIRHLLGEGGMGEVYLAYDGFLQREVAIKLAKLELLDDPEIGDRMRKMWMNETRLAGKLKHPHIAEVFESGTTEEFGYLVMEYVSGGTLKQYTKPDALLPMEQVIEHVYKVCNALDYSAKMGLLHRDIKPANIMITTEGVVKLVDFGTAYFTKSDETQVLDVGTVPWMPPEHFRDWPPTVRLDIYAMGVVAYQLLTGTMPFTAESIDALIKQKLDGVFVPLDDRRKDIPNELRFVVHRAIHADPQVRYDNWQTFCDDLRNALPQLERPNEVFFETSRFDSMRHMDFFHGFPDTQLWEIIHFSNWLDMREGEVVFEEGSHGDNVYVIANGDVEIVRAGARLNTLTAGDCIGELSFLDETRNERSATVRALSPLVLIEIPGANLRNGSGDLQAAFGRALMRIMLKRIRHADERYLTLVRNSER